MDPNETLRTIREAIRTARTITDNDALEHEYVYVALGAFEDLDEWLSRGGFPPEEWREGPDAVPARVICDRHGGAWGDDETCERCTFEAGGVRPVGEPGPLRDDDYTSEAMDRDNG